MSPRDNSDETRQRLASMQPMPEDLPEAAAEPPGAIKAGSLVGRSLPMAIWLLAAPILVQQFLAACVGLADKVMAGGLPDWVVLPAMDAIGIGSYVGWFIAIAASGIGIGGQALIARAMGSGDRDLAHRALGQSMLLAGGWGILVGIALWFAASPLAVLTELSDEASVYLVQYIRVLSIAMPACCIMNAGAMALHGSGDTLRPALVTAAVNVVNVIVSLVLSGADIRLGETTVINPWSWDLHVIGIATGTAAAYVAGAVLIVVVLFRGVKDLRLRWADMRLDLSVIGRVARIGIPNFLEGISMWTANLFVLQFIGQVSAQMAVRMGSDEPVMEGLQGANIIAAQWESFSFLPGFAFGVSAGTLAGQFLGAGDRRRARLAVLACTGIAIIVMGTLGIAMMLFGRDLTLVISDMPIHLAIVPALLLIGGASQPAFAVMMVMRQALLGTGDTTWTFILTTISSYGVRLPMAWYLGIHLEWGLIGIQFALCGEILVRATFFFGRFMQGGWAKRAI